MKDIIISEKIRDNGELLEGIADIIPPIKVVWISNLVDFIPKYKWLINNADFNII